MRLHSRIAALVFTLGTLSIAASALAQGSAGDTPPPDPWPRGVDLGNAQVLVYQPQINSWTDNQLNFRAALAIKPTGAKAETFGVIFATARTQVDKVLRTVTFENLKISKIDFPSNKLTFQSIRTRIREMHDQPRPIENGIEGLHGLVVQEEIVASAVFKMALWIFAASRRQQAIIFINGAAHPASSSRRRTSGPHIDSSGSYRNSRNRSYSSIERQRGLAILRTAVPTGLALS